MRVWGTRGGSKITSSARSRRAGPGSARCGLNRLAFLNRPTGQVIRRYERSRPGELIHVDVKKLGRIPDGGGWRVHGRAACPDRRRTTHFNYIHSAVDDHSRLAYSEVHADEKAATCAAFLTRAAAFFATCGILRIERVPASWTLLPTSGSVQRREHSRPS